MSTRFNYLFIIFCIFVLNLPKKWKIANATAIYYHDYSYLDAADKDYNEYFENSEVNNNKLETPNDKYVNAEKRNTYELNGSEDNYPAECKPPLEVTESSSKPSTTESPPPNQCSENSENDTQDVIDRVTQLIKSMREHVIGLLKNMNELETNILENSSTDVHDSKGNNNNNNNNSSCNSTNSERELMYDMEKLTNQDVIAQTPGYVINEWSAPVKIDIIPSEKQANEFMEEAQAAVRSWKQQIETCKRILDNAVSRALENSNIKSNIISDVRPCIQYVTSNVDESSAEQKQNELNHNMPDVAPANSAPRLTFDKPVNFNFKGIRSNNGQRKYTGLYDTLHGLNGGF